MTRRSTSAHRSRLDRAQQQWQERQRVVYLASEGDHSRRTLSRQLHAVNLRELARRLDTLERRMRTGSSWRQLAQDIAVMMSAYGEATTAHRLYRMASGGVTAAYLVGDLDDLQRELVEQAELAEHGVECRRCGFVVMPDSVPVGPCMADPEKPCQVPVQMTLDAP